MEETQPWIAAPPYPETNIFRGSHKRPAAYLWIVRPSRLRSSAALIRWTPETNKTSFQSPKSEQLRQATAASRTPPWLPSGWGCRGRRLSRA